MEIARLNEMERHVHEHTGLTLRNMKMLDVGAGQRLVQMTYFTALGNLVVGIDRDIIVQGFDPLAYWRMHRSNGGRRVLKTIARKALGIDARYHVELSRQLRTPPKHGRLAVHQMNASGLDFSTESFDFIYAFRVLQHLDAPVDALNEVVRVLRPGGAAYLDFMPYTGPHGSLDLRMLDGHAHDLPPWAHLRPQHRDLVNESAYLNRLGLADWRLLFETAMPGYSILLAQPDTARLTTLADQLWGAGELLQYELDDLVTSDATVIWKKPPL